MPNTNRLTWDGTARHAGSLPRYPVFHGCVHLPLAFSALLFEVTHLGTQVIIADEHHFPTEGAHPEKALAAHAVHAFEEVLTTLAGKKHPVDWAVDGAKPIVPLIASSHECEIVLIENDVEIGRGALIWDGDPLGSHVDVLNGVHGAANGFHGPAPSFAAPGPDQTQDLSRLTSDAAFTALIREHLHPGTVSIVTDLPRHRDIRSGRDFVIIS